MLTKTEINTKRIETVQELLSENIYNSIKTMIITYINNNISNNPFVNKISLTLAENILKCPEELQTRGYLNLAIHRMQELSDYANKTLLECRLELVSFILKVDCNLDCEIVEDTIYIYLPN